MPVDISKYCKKTRLSNILDVANKDVLVNALAGYAHVAFSGVVVCYKTCIEDPKGTKDIHCLDSGGESAREWCRPFCGFYRYDCGQVAKCAEFDKTVALEFYKNLKKEPMLYRCHRDVWDMAFPLRIRRQLVGVLLGGQMIVRKRSTVWRRELDEIYKYVCWDYSNSNERDENQKAAIINSLREDGVLSEEQITYAQNMLEQETAAVKGAFVTLPDLVKRFKDFLQFGKTIESLLAPLHDANVHAEEGALLSNMANDLAKSSTSGQWWETLVEVLRKFQKATGVSGIDIYIRKQSNFIQEIDSGEIIEEVKLKRRVPVNICAELSNDELVDIDESEYKGRLREYFKEPTKYLYRFDLAGFRSNQHLCTLIAVRSLGNNDSVYDFMKDFCSMVSLRSNVERALSQIEEEQEEYTKRVRNISHTVKTPLQVAINAIRRSRKTLLAIADNIIKDEACQHLDNARKNILRSKTEMQELHVKSSLAKKPENVCELLLELARELEPLAYEKKCWFDTGGISSKIILCNVQRDHFRIAMRNLMDNAVKFSFEKKYIKLSVRATAEGSAFIEISDYGVGIPDEKKEVIRLMGERAHVIDHERPDTMREGTGLGLPIAIDIIHDHGGSIHLESNRLRENRDDSLYEVTKAIISLPLHFSVNKE